MDLGELVALEHGTDAESQLLRRITKLERRVSMLTAVLRLVLALLRLSGFELGHHRVPDAEGKRRLLGAIERARKSIPLASALRVLGLSAGRYHDLVGRQDGCSLDDRSCCPRSKPRSLTHQEVGTIGDMVQSKDYRHMSIRGLALHAQRVGKVFAHPGTWAKLIRERGWGRPRMRPYPPKPKLGFRATGPNEAWHVDATIIKLLDGTKVYLHAVIDNYSRRILAWTVAGTLNPMNTCYVLQRAAAGLSDPATKVYMDSGVENLNKDVDKPLENGALDRRGHQSTPGMAMAWKRKPVPESICRCRQTLVVRRHCGRSTIEVSHIPAYKVHSRRKPTLFPVRSADENARTFF